MLQNLQYLVLFSNQLTGTLPPSWSELVHVSHNTCHKDMHCFAHRACSSDYSWNMFMPSCVHIPYLMQLSLLALDYNRLTGTLPEDWSTFTSVSLQQCIDGVCS